MLGAGIGIGKFGGGGNSETPAQTPQAQTQQVQQQTQAGNEELVQVSDGKGGLVMIPKSVWNQGQEAAARYIQQGRKGAVGGMGVSPLQRTQDSGTHSYDEL